MNDSEAFAKACVEILAAPAQLRPVLDQSHGEHDFHIEWPDGRIGALEVTQIADARLLRLYDAVLGKKPNSDTVEAKRSRGNWHVILGEHAIVKDVRRLVDRYLADVEAEGLETFYAPHDRFRSPSVRAIQNDLQVEHGIKVHDIPGLIRIRVPFGGGSVDPEAVNRAMAEVAGLPDNLRKLSRPEHAERHLFAYVDARSYGAHSPLLLTEKVASPLSVDSLITHLWVGTHTWSPSDGVVWRAENGRPWRLCRFQCSVNGGEAAEPRHGQHAT